MNVKDFIIAQAAERADAAQVLREALEINGIIFKPGCTEEGISISGDIGALSAILGCELKTEIEKPNYESSYDTRTRSFNFGGVKFSSSDYVKKEVPENAECGDKEHE